MTKGKSNNGRSYRIIYDYKLNTSEERLAYIQTQLEGLGYDLEYGLSKWPDALTDYILCDQTRKFHAWTKTQPLSLEGLREANSEKSSFSYEPAITMHGTKADPIISKVSKRKFNRETTRNLLGQNSSNAWLLRLYEDLWAQIDRADYITTIYAKKPIRPELAARIRLAAGGSDEQYELACHELHDKASKLAPLDYTLLKRQLVDLRTQQYSLSDVYINSIGTIVHAPTHVATPSEQKLSIIEALNFQDANIISLLIYAAPSILEGLRENIYALEDAEEWQQAMDKLALYGEMANFNDISKELLTYKAQGKLNTWIAKTLNAKYGTSYSASYVSTAYGARCKKIANMARAAIEEQDTPYKKICNTCGKTLPATPNNFVRRKSAPDGLSNRCKKCDAAER